MPEDELTALLTLNRIEGLGCTGAKFLYDQLGSAQEIFRSRDHLKELIPGVNSKLIEALDGSRYSFFVREELEFVNRHGIRYVTPADSDYPARLRDCKDAPLVLFSLGNVNYNASRTVSIVGTRNATENGRKICRTFVNELHRLCPDVVIVSGLAYGIDVEAHRACLNEGCSTLGVLAHGLDMIYPQSHRETARNMLEKGGLVTEFHSRTIPLKHNFVQRNRIIAGLSDAVVVVESTAKGGALVTAEIAESYGRECFAFPGRIDDSCSVGCNELIRDNHASMICSALDFVEAMNWLPRHRPDNQPELFPLLSAQEQAVLDCIAQKSEGIHVNTIITALNIPYSRLMTILFNLENKSLVHVVSGSLCFLLSK